MTGKVQSNQRFSPNSRDMNRQVESSDEAAQRRYGSPSDPLPQLPREHLVALRNWSATGIPPRSGMSFQPCHNIGDTATVGDTRELEPDLLRPVWDTYGNLASGANIPFGVTPQGMQSYATGDVQIGGVCSALVYVHDKLHWYASTQYAPTGLPQNPQLVSSPTGTVRILWKPPEVTKPLVDWALTGDNEASGTIHLAHRLQTGTYNLAWPGDGGYARRNGVSVTITGNAATITGGSGESLPSSGPVYMTSIPTGLQRCIVQLGQYQPRVGFSAYCDDLTHYEPHPPQWLTWENTFGDAIIPGATQDWPIGSGWEWVADDKAFRCRQPGVYSIRGDWAVQFTGNEGSEVVAYLHVDPITHVNTTFYGLQFPAFSVAVYGDNYSYGQELGGGAAVCCPFGTGGVTGQGFLGNLHFEFWKAFVYDEKLRFWWAETQPYVHSAVASYLENFHGQIHVNLLEAHGRPSP